MFTFAVAQKMLAEKPISMARESKPGKNPKNGAHAFTGEELAAIGQATVYKNSRKQTIDDAPTFLLLRWAGLRVSDAVQLRWKHVHFGRGPNGEIEILTQKRNKVAIIPLSTELRENLESFVVSASPAAKITYCSTAGVGGEYEVVLSFAGEDREYVEKVAHILRTNEVSVFYDNYEEASLWGKDLVEHLHKVYSGSARFCVMFISKHYAEKVWPTHERRRVHLASAV
jgi:hypothetical protein